MGLRTSTTRELIITESSPEIDRHIVEHRPLDVREFLASGTALDDSTIDDAIEAAKSEAYAATSEAAAWCYDVKVPARRYHLTNRHDFPGTGVNTPTPGLVGEGGHQTVFEVSSDAGDWVFTFGTDGAGSDKYTYKQLIQGFSVVGAGSTAARSGIRSRSGYLQTFRDVLVRGFEKDQTYDKGCGIDIGVSDPGVAANNHQHLTMEDVHVQECLKGIELEGVWPGNLSRVHVHGNYLHNVVLHGSNSGLVWAGGDLQFAGGGGNLGLWHGGRDAPGVVSGWHYTSGLASGSTATCGVASGFICTLIGLSGLVASDRGRWITLAPGIDTANKLKVRGIYKIESVLSATSCTIVKGSNHTSQSGCVWQICGTKGGNYVTFRDKCYDESPKRAAFGFYRDEVTSSRYMVDDCEINNATYNVDADGVGQVTVIHSGVVGSFGLRVRDVATSYTDHPKSQVSCDDESYPGLIAGSGLHTSKGSNKKSVRHWSKERGAVDAWDARIDSLLSLGGADVHSWTGLINGTVLTPQNAGVYAQYDAADSGLGKCVKVIGSATPGSVGNLQGTISGGVLPSVAFRGSVFAVYRLPATTVNGGFGAGHTAIRAEGANRTDELRFNDNNLLSNQSIYFAMYSAFNSGSVTTAALPGGVDTLAHAIVGGSSATGPMKMSGDAYGADWVNGGNNAIGDYYLASTGIPFKIGPNFGSATGNLNVAFVAFFPRALTEDEQVELIDLARQEWSLVQ